MYISAKRYSVLLYTMRVRVSMGAWSIMHENMPVVVVRHALCERLGPSIVGHTLLCLIRLPMKYLVSEGYRDAIGRCGREVSSSHFTLEMTKQSRCNTPRRSLSHTLILVMAEYHFLVPTDVTNTFPGLVTLKTFPPISGSFSLSQ